MRPAFPPTRRLLRSGLRLAVLVCALAGYGFVFELEVARLTADYEDGNPPQRHETIRIARRMETPAVLVLLRRALGDDDSAVRLEAAEALIDRGDETVLETVLPWLDGRDEVPRIVAAHAVARFHVEDARDRIERMVDDADAEVRLAAVQAIDALGNGLRVLVRTFEDDDAIIRRAVVEAIGHLHDSDAESTLARAARDVDPQVRREAIEAIGRIEGADVTTIGLAALEDSDSGVVAAALRLLGRSRDPTLGGAIASRLDSDDDDVGIAAVFALADLDPAAQASTLVGRLSDTRLASAVEVAFRSIPSDGASHCVDASLVALTDDAVRERAARILASCLERAPAQGERAARILAAIEDRPSPELADALAFVDDERASRTATVLAAGEDETIAIHALAALEARLRDAPDGRVAEPLLLALEHGSSARRVAMYRVLGRSGATRVASRLSRGARNETDSELAARIEALARLGPNAAIGTADRLLASSRPGVAPVAAGILCSAASTGSIVESLIDRARDGGSSAAAAIDVLACGLAATHPKFVSRRNPIVAAITAALASDDARVFAAALDASVRLGIGSLESVSNTTDARSFLVRERLALHRAAPCGEPAAFPPQTSEPLAGVRVVVRLPNDSVIRVTVDSRSRLPSDLGCATGIEMQPRGAR